jgi:nickel-dependent lactate racemase
MHTPTYTLPYSRTLIQFELPASLQVHLVRSKPAAVLTDVPASLRHALEHPIGSPPLRQLARPGQGVCIVYTDATRSSPDHILVPAILRELELAGVRDEEITLLCGIGMHRPSTVQEKQAKLGEDVVKRYRVIDHEPQNPGMLADLGSLQDGIPIQIHRSAVEADLLIATGIVEPHQYAGYSGGRKTVAIGAGGEALIAATHGPDFVDHPGTRLGRIEGNPFHAVVSKAARRAGLRFILNVVLNEDQQIVKLAAGDPELAFEELVRFARTVYEVPVQGQYDIVIGGVGYPKDSNIYQASRAPSYLFFAPTPVIRPGGYFIIPARCEEGAGAGVGEQRFLAAMRDAPDVSSILENARQHGYPPGQQRAFVMAKVLEKNKVILVGSECPDLVAACKLIPAKDMQEALSIATGETGSDARVLIVPHALQTLPIVAGKGGTA